MPAFSKVARPSAYSAGGADHLSFRTPPPRDYSLPSNQGELDDSLEHEPRIARRSGPAMSYRSRPHNSHSHYDHHTHDSGSHSGNTHLSAPLKIYRSHVSPLLGDNDPDSIELMELRAENAKLKRDMQEIETRRKTSLYVFEYSTHYMRWL